MSKLKKDPANGQLQYDAYSKMMNWHFFDPAQEQTTQIPEGTQKLYCRISVTIAEGRCFFSAVPDFSHAAFKVHYCFDFVDESPQEAMLLEIIKSPLSGGEAVFYNLPSYSISEKVNAQCIERQVALYPYKMADIDGQSMRVYELHGPHQLALLLKGPQMLTIFEHNALSSLCKKLKQSDNSSQEESFGGFKIANSHFRLGSKIHISDFYYAKRFFQNNFYASGFSYLIAKAILKRLCQDQGADFQLIKKTGLTLIGYGLYSELLLSQVVKLLQPWIATKRFNHNLISDEEDLSLIKKYTPVYNRVFMIIPISSTFSTSVKIEEALKILKPKLEVFEPHLNIINVHDTDQRSAEDNLTEKERKFGWKHWQSTERTVVIKALSESRGELEKSQRYFLRLPTKWHDIKNCALCFGQDQNIPERPLFITDKTSLTPVLIFATPKGRAIKDQNRFILNHQLLNYGHFLSEKNHYLFYLQKERFFNKNKKGIDSWLGKLAKEFKKKYSPHQPIVILAPGNYTNAGFVALVNSRLFSSRAKIIHYDPTNDHIQNFSAFYGEELNRMVKVGEQRLSPKVIFVDDTLVAGSTFITTNYFVKHNRKEQKGFDSCIIMLDRSSHFVHANVVRKLSDKNDYHAFANLHLSAINDIDNSCPLCKEKDRYELLASQSYLDKLRVHFLSKALKLRVQDPSAVLPDVSSDRNIRMLEGTHLIYEWFSKGEEAKWAHPFQKIEDFQSLEDWTENVLKNTSSPFELESLAGALPERISDAFLKILTQSPFTRYKPVKEKVFHWVMNLLKAHRTLIIQQCKDAALNYPDFRRLKFLIRRAGLLNINYLISTSFLDMMQTLLSPKGLQALIHRLKQQQGGEELKKKLQSQIENLQQFHTFYTAQIKELLFLSEARSVRLEHDLAQYAMDKNSSSAFHQLIRILREENGVLIQQFHDFIAKEPGWIEKKSATKPLRHPEKHSLWDQGMETIETILARPSVQEHYHYKTLMDFFANGSQPNPPAVTGYFDSFLNFLYLQRFLSGDKTNAEGLNIKTALLMEKLKQIVMDGKEVRGAFFAVRLKSAGDDQLFFAYNEGNRREVRAFKPEEKESYFMKFLNGLADSSGASHYTLVELKRDSNNNWQDLYAVNQQHIPSIFGETDIPEDYNRLVLFRINKRFIPQDESSTQTLIDEAQGMMCFYFKQDDDVPTAVGALRYLLLLRPAISKFIEDHHEHNEFRDLVEANSRRRMAMLTGHGSEMLLKIAEENEDDRYRNILTTLMFTQRFVLDMDGYKGISYPAYYKQSFNRFFKMEQGKIDLSYISTSLRSLAEGIFGFSSIENTELVKYIPSEKQIEFSYSQNILDSICFELFLNAKKNRYIFLKGTKIKANKNCEFEPAQNIIFDKNYIWVALSVAETGQPIITISNTVPGIPPMVMSKLKSSGNVKNSEIGGLELIKTILKNFEFGTINFSSYLINQKSCLHCFQAELTLNVKADVIA